MQFNWISVNIKGKKIREKTMWSSDLFLRFYWRLIIYNVEKKFFVENQTKKEWDPQWLVAYAYRTYCTHLTRCHAWIGTGDGGDISCWPSSCRRTRSTRRQKKTQLAVTHPFTEHYSNWWIIFQMGLRMSSSNQTLNDIKYQVSVSKFMITSQKLR